MEIVDIFYVIICVVGLGVIIILYWVDVNYL